MLRKGRGAGERRTDRTKKVSAAELVDTQLAAYGLNVRSELTNAKFTHVDVTPKAEEVLARARAAAEDDSEPEAPAPPPRARPTRLAREGVRRAVAAGGVSETGTSQPSEGSSDPSWMSSLEKGRAVQQPAPKTHQFAKIMSKVAKQVK